MIEEFIMLFKVIIIKNNFYNSAGVLLIENMAEHIENLTQNRPWKLLFE